MSHNMREPPWNIQLCFLGTTQKSASMLCHLKAWVNPCPHSQYPSIYQYSKPSTLTAECSHIPRTRTRNHLPAEPGPRCPRRYSFYCKGPDTFGGATEAQHGRENSSAPLTLPTLLRAHQLQFPILKARTDRQRGQMPDSLSPPRFPAGTQTAAPSSRTAPAARAHRQRRLRSHHPGESNFQPRNTE